MHFLCKINRRACPFIRQVRVLRWSNNYSVTIGIPGKVGLLVYQFMTKKNDFESTNFEMFEEVVHNFGK